ncbi:MAG: Asp-tRNA(Asn)/Glu-tRNA(Gln) amidotransferase GatCAB subunit A, partial [Spirochaetales bacterium]|nr:Asp-tRNA(Asn)/Glu-tRNA(Gln) amidotransferase GatCAB subunit A [Spirochaetales bacterium]
MAWTLDDSGVGSVQLVTRLLERIAAVDRSGPTLGSVLYVNDQALQLAAERDSQRGAGRVLGPLHGVPVLIKASIDTADSMPTSAGSTALAGRKAARDAAVVANLRAAGAIILGKTNMSEWANFRSRYSSSGWSSEGGQSRNPYALDRSPSGSSSGSAVAVAAGLCPMAVGTETDGSSGSPAAVNGVVGIKPEAGRLSQAGIVPISS